jgi:Caspase domain
MKGPSEPRTPARGLTNLPATLTAPSGGVAAASLEDLHPLVPEGGRVKVLIVGIEEYAHPEQLQRVAYARADADAFEVAARDCWPGADIVKLVDNRATLSLVEGAVRDHAYDADLLVFYYAGHGFHDGTSNRLTVWDTRLHDLDSTTVDVERNIFQAVRSAGCDRIMVFLDACAKGMKREARDALASLDPKAFREFVRGAEFAVVFTSCKPGESSFPSAELKQGIWTHHLVRALQGLDPLALGPHRTITGDSLQNALSEGVLRFVRERGKTLQNKQTPQIYARSNHTFGIRHVPPAISSALPALQIATEVSLEGDSSGKIRSLSEFKPGNVVPKEVSNYYGNFVRRLLQPEIKTEIETVFNAARRAFGIRMKDMKASAQDGGSLDANSFRYSIVGGQDSDDPSMWRLQRYLILANTDADTLRSADEAFGWRFQRLAFQVKEWPLDYEALAERFEDLELSDGGNMTLSPLTHSLAYEREEICIEVDMADNRIVVGAGAKATASAVIQRARAALVVLAPLLQAEAN